MLCIQDSKLGVNQVMSDGAIFQLSWKLRGAAEEELCVVLVLGTSRHSYGGSTA